MVYRQCVEALDQNLADILGVQINCIISPPFGGKVVFRGDFRHIHVIPKGSRHDIVHVSLNYSKHWH